LDILKNCCNFAVSKERDEKLLPHEAEKNPTRGRKNYHESPLHLPLWGSETRKRKIFTKTPFATFGGVMNAKGHSIKAAKEKTKL
jgi:hypothetical protein